jgi:hypothetical protein
MSQASRERDDAVPFPSDAEEPEEQLIMHLEHDQLVAETLRPLPRAHVSPRALLGLWMLRIFVVMVSAMVIYTFISRLG